ncbi:MAG: TIGR03905 family TSCPD domain-containing protein [Defluviitaleaceae bacterium]|nr:TIGR03905 family TSCPD domain-containing protein [Defluviitaleaceae bacterium]
MTYRTKGVCSNEIFIDVQGGVINEVKFSNGCQGNLQGISQLAKGRKVDEIIPLISGIKCGMRGTSCPDQLAIALRELEKK